MSRSCSRRTGSNGWLLRPSMATRKSVWLA